MRKDEKVRKFEKCYGGESEKSQQVGLFVCVCVEAEVIPFRWKHSVDEASTAAGQRMRLSTSQGWPAVLIPGQSLGESRKGREEEEV